MIYDKNMVKGILESYFLNLKSQRAFTLIELIIVFSLITILSGIGIASFVTYAHSQEVQTTIQDIKTTLFTARSRALSQLKQGTCGSSDLQLQGYQVMFCCSFAGCPTCVDSADGYEMQIVCSNQDGTGQTAEVVYSKKFPNANVSVLNSSQTTATSFFFSSVTGAVSTNRSGSGLSQVAINGYGITKIATVSATGVIQ